MNTRSQPPIRAYRLPLLVIGLALLIWGQISLLTEYLDLPAGLIPIAIGLVIVAYVWLRHPPTGESPPESARPGEIPPPKLDMPGLELLGVGVVLAIIAAIRADQTITGMIPSYLEMFLLWGGSIAAFLMGTVQPGELRQRWQGSQAIFRAEPRHFALVAALTLVALSVRTTGLEGAPSLLSFDEGSFAYEASFIANGSFRASPFEPAWLSHPRLFFCILALSIQALGRTALAARLPSAIFGALTVPAIYALGRQIYGRRVGLVAAAYLTGFHMHVHFSRLALNNIVDPLWTTLTFAFLVRGLRTGRLSDFGLAGVSLGMSQYFYAAARLIPFLVIAYLLITLVLRPAQLRGRLLHIGVLLLGALIVTWPADWFYITESYPLTTRLSATGLFATGRFDTMRQTMSATQALWEQLKWSFLALIHTHDHSGFYGPIAPVMGRFAGVPFLLGVLYSLLRLPRLIRNRIAKSQSLISPPESLLPILWLVAIVIAGSALLIDPPHFPRYVALTPAAALLVGLGVVETVRMGAQGFALHPQARRIPQWIAVGIGVALMTADLVYYFDVYLQAPVYVQDFTTRLGNAVSDYLAEETADNPNLNVYYLTSPQVFLDNSSLIGYFVPNVRDRDIPSPILELPEGFDPGSDNLFILAGGRIPDLDVLERELPGGWVGQHLTADGSVLFVTYRVGPQERQQ